MSQKNDTSIEKPFIERPNPPGESHGVLSPPDDELKTNSVQYEPPQLIHLGTLRSVIAGGGTSLCDNIGPGGSLPPDPGGEC